MNVGFLGASHLGQVYSAATAMSGMRISLVDTDDALIEALHTGPTVVEPGLAEAWQETNSMRSCTTNLDALSGCQLVFVTRDVPTGDDGESEMSVIEDLINGLSRVLVGSGVPVVLMSQVIPGTTRRLSKIYSDLSYQVETLVFGNALHRARHPERHIVGVLNQGLQLHPRHREWLSAFPAEQFIMRLESAELAKIAINLYLAATVSTTNSLAELARAVGADWGEIVPTLKADRRIGPFAYLSPGLGITGGNIERDLASFLQLSNEFAVRGEVIESFRKNSEYHRQWALRELKVKGLNGRGRIGVLGLAYKSNTASTKNSASLTLLRSLGGQHVRVHDPKVGDIDLPPTAHRFSRWIDVVSETDAVVVMTPWPEYSKIDAGTLAGLMKGRLVIDPFAVLDGKAMRDHGIDYRSLSRSD